MGALQDASHNRSIGQLRRNCLYDYHIFICILAPRVTGWAGYDELRVFSIWSDGPIKHRLVHGVRQEGVQGPGRRD